MSKGLLCDEDLIRRLPLPLARLYRRAHNAKTPLDRHQAAYYLWEASLKLLGSVAIVAYAERGLHQPELAGSLQNLARPAVGHWWEFVRKLVPILADNAGDAGFCAIRDLVLGRARTDMPQAAALDIALREALGETAGSPGSVRLSALFDRMVCYRNREVGHGAAGQRPRDFYSCMGGALLTGVAELLGRMDVLAGRGLVYIEDVRRLASGRWLIERFALIGEVARRIESLEQPESDTPRLPRPERIYFDVPGPQAIGAERPSLVEVAAPSEYLPRPSLHPLVIYDPARSEILFLNAQRDRQRTEYLCYTTGEHVEHREWGDELRDLLARAVGGSVESTQVERWAAQSLAEEDQLAPQVPEPIGPQARRIGEFELLSELGRGNMGKVYRSWQPSLGRQVALKILSRADDPKAKARFRREIQALGRVDHPNLVKIFTSGFDEEPCFFTMELVEGATLDAVCDRLQSRSTSAAVIDLDAWRELLSTACEESRRAEKALSDSGSSSRHVGLPVGVRQSRPPLAQPSADQSYVLQIVELMRQVALAAHALHQAGVVHRDIKPGNIMVTADGSQGVLMDLGLAHLADEAEGRLTRTRQFVGTLRYASPEQVLAAGSIDRRTDIYSLGATFWELLTLRPIYGSTDQMSTPELMRRITSDEPERIRKYNPRIASDLEAIVYRCLEKDPNRRYATAGELSEDLARWQRSEPVTAHPPTLRYVAGRYVRRRIVPLAISAVAVLGLLVTAIVALLIHSILIGREKARVEEQRVLAQRNFERARDAVDQLLTEVGEVELADVPQMEPVRKRLLAKAQRFYLDFLEEKRTDPNLLREAGRAYCRLGEIQEILGEYPSAESAFRQAIELLEEQSAQRPAGVDTRPDLARCSADLGSLLKKANRFREAEIFCRSALSLRELLASEYPDDPDHRQALADCRYNLGTLLARLPRRSREDEQAYRDALRLQEELAATAHDQPENRSKRARYLNNLGLLLAATGRADEAGKAYREALAILEHLSQTTPAMPGYRWLLARTANNLGVLLEAVKQHAEAETVLRRALALQEELVASFPHIPTYRQELASIHNNLGLLLMRTGTAQAAEESLHRAIQLREGLVADFPEMPDYRQKLAVTRHNLGILLEKTAPQRAEKAFRDALEDHEKLAATFPGVPEYELALGQGFYSLGELLVRRGELAQAHQALSQAIEHQRAALAANPQNPSVRAALRAAYRDLTEVLTRLGEHAGAASAVEELPRLAPDELQEYLRAAAFLARCVALAAEDTKLPEARREALGQTYARRGVELLRQAYDRKLLHDGRELQRHDYDSLRERDDFKELRETLETRARVGVG